MHRQSDIQPENGHRGAAKEASVAHLAAQSRGWGSRDEVLGAILDVSTVKNKRPAAVHGFWAQKELECAREFSFELSSHLPVAASQMEQALQKLMDVNHCLILVFEEQTGLYVCLGDLFQTDRQVRECPHVSDDFLQTMMETESAVLHSPLLCENGLIGLVTVADKTDNAPFAKQDQILLDLIAPYLAAKLSRLIEMKKLQAVSRIQGVVLELAERLITAVDQDAIIMTLLEVFAGRLGFDACQYVSFNQETGLGEVLYEVRKPLALSEDADSRLFSGKACAGKIKVQSFSHAGLTGKRRVIRDYANLVGLLSSLARKRFYLQLNGQKLGDRSLREIFGIRNIESALLLPVVDISTGQIQGTFNLFHTTQGFISEEKRQIACEGVQLSSQALSRALVLQKALAMASSDELTGLINRRGYYQRFEAELERARRQQKSLCVALIDVDHFKHFNDTYGHLSGDLVLKALSDLLTKNMRKSDVVCRFGGEEFAVLLPDTSLKFALELLERVRHSVESLTLEGMNGEPLSVTISIGLAEVYTHRPARPNRSEISEALAKADKQLYVAKDEGRNRICYCSDVSQAI